MCKRILVPVNGSRASAAGLHEAIGLAQELGVRMRLIHVIDKRVIKAGTRAGGDCAAGLCDALVTSGRSILERARSSAEQEGVEVDDAISRFAIDRAASAILADSEQWRSYLIDIGKRARSSLSRLFTSSDADLVSKDARVPVLVVQVDDGL